MPGGDEPARSRRVLVGRDEEIERLLARSRGLVALPGARGSGRTAVLHQLAHRLREQGRVVLALSPEASERAVSAALVDAVGARFEDFDGHPELMSALRRARRAVADVRRGPSPAGVVHETGRLLGRVGPPGSVVVVIDDADGLGASPAVLCAAAAAGHLVVLAIGLDTSSDILALADAVVELTPLSDEEAGVLMEAAAGLRLGPTVADRVQRALGAWRGNAGALVGAIEELRRTGRLVEVHEHLCAASPDLRVTLPTDHPAVRAVHGIGPAAVELVVLARDHPRFALDDLETLTWATGRPARDYGRALDALVAAGVIEVGSWERLFVTSPAVATTVAERFGVDRVRRLHAGLAVALRSGDVTDAERARGAAFAPTVLADHVMASEPTLRPDPVLGALLLDQGRIAGRRSRTQAVAHYRAALRHVRDGEHRAELVHALGSLLLAVGDYGGLSDVVADLVRHGVDVEPPRTDLAVLAALATMHTGIPLPGDIRDALVDRAPECPLSAADRWFAGGRIEPGELAMAFRALPALARPGPASDTSGSPAPPRIASTPRLERALADRDLVPVLTAVFPDCYIPPTRGSAADHHRVVRGHRDGPWSDALAAGHLLIASGAGSPSVRALAAVRSAEMLAWRGQTRLARLWLGSASVADGHESWRALVAIEATDEEEPTDWPRVIDRALGQDTIAPAEARTLLFLLLWTAVAVLQEDRPRWRRWLRATLPGLGRLDTGDRSDVLITLIDALCRNDARRAEAATDALRTDCDRAELTLARLGTGLIARDPGPWLLEARAVADPLGAVQLVALVNRAMSRRRVPFPRDPAPDELTTLENELVDMVTKGRTNRQIAARLHLSQKTVETHLSRLFLKAGCRNRYDLVSASVDGRLRDTVA